MANGMTHSIVGGMSGLAVSLIDTDDNGQATHNPLISTAVGTIVGKLPDILEPALNPHHRQFFHSIAVLVALGYSVKKVYEWQPEDEVETFFKTVLLCAGAGYISHLLLDATTPRSLPLLGKI